MNIIINKPKFYKILAICAVLLTVGYVVLLKMDTANHSINNKVMLIYSQLMLAVIAAVYVFLFYKMVESMTREGESMKKGLLRLVSIFAIAFAIVHFGSKYYWGESVFTHLSKPHHLRNCAGAGMPTLGC